MSIPMMGRQISRFFCISLMAVCGLARCGGSSGSDTADGSLQPVKSTLRTVVIPTQRAFATATDDLSAAAQTFCEAPNVNQLTAVREAWKEARLAWNATDAFQLYGPATDLDAVNLIDTWPVQEAAVENLLNASDVLTATTMAEKSAAVRGLPIIEYLLYPSGASDTETVARFTSHARRCEYLRAAADDTADLALRMAAQWQGADGFATDMEKAGGGSTRFPTSQSAIDAMFTGMVRAVERLESAKITKPLGSTPETAVPDAVEAPLAGTSMEHWRRSLDGIRATYFCEHSDSDPQPSVADLVQLESPSIAADIRAQFTRLDDAADAITQPLAKAVTSQRTEVEALKAELDIMKSLLSQDAAAVLGVVIVPGFSSPPAHAPVALRQPRRQYP